MRRYQIHHRSTLITMADTRTVSTTSGLIAHMGIWRVSSHHIILRMVRNVPQSKPMCLLMGSCPQRLSMAFRVTLVALSSRQLPFRGKRTSLPSVCLLRISHRLRRHRVCREKVAKGMTPSRA